MTIGNAVSDREFSKQVLARLHGMARTKICKSRRCQVCKELPRERPTTPSAENNVLLAMREARIREELMRAALPSVVSLTHPTVPVASASVEPPKQAVYVLPVAQGCRWGAVGNLINHAFESGNSLCGKWPWSMARFDYAAPHYCRACRAQMGV